MKQIVDASRCFPKSFCYFHCRSAYQVLRKQQFNALSNVEIFENEPFIMKDVIFLLTNATNHI